MYCNVHMFRRLRKIIPSQLVLNIYKSHIQSRVDYGQYVRGSDTEVNLAQMIGNNNFDYINCSGIDMLGSLKVHIVRERRNYFLCILMFMCIHGLDSRYLCNDLINVSGMIQAVRKHGFKSTRLRKGNLYRNFPYKGSFFWHQLPPRASYQIRKIAGRACAGNDGNVFPATTGAVMHAGIAN